ncbi:hypothetical protein GALMADRAFT_1052590 [Galerina marginata CBS 339.88]|uniref:Uncharacterized protein n=1 Tax=Galerina marginata (strain CBS 339.88) TaxID=685588 RepID=A0A067SB55_GALM3|nr:hypothetical protein GALMADRAFT_1052590 [Galerina marginata CBS 339.88]
MPQQQAVPYHRPSRPRRSHLNSSLLSSLVFPFSPHPMSSIYLNFNVDVDGSINLTPSPSPPSHAPKNRRSSTSYAGFLTYTAAYMHTHPPRWHLWTPHIPGTRGGRASLRLWGGTGCTSSTSESGWEGLTSSITELVSKFAHFRDVLYLNSTGFCPVIDKLLPRLSFAFHSLLAI